MIQWSPRSQRHIDQLHRSLQRLLEDYADEVERQFDITITDSFRDEMAQNQAFKAGRSKLLWPNSAHNKQPALAFDFCCAGVDKGHEYIREPMLMRQGVIRHIAEKRGIKLKPLILWDLPHVEIDLT